MGCRSIWPVVVDQLINQRHWGLSQCVLWALLRWRRTGELVLQEMTVYNILSCHWFVWVSIDGVRREQQLRYLVIMVCSLFSVMWKLAGFSSPCTYLGRWYGPVGSDDFQWSSGREEESVLSIHTFHLCPFVSVDFEGPLLLLIHRVLHLSFLFFRNLVFVFHLLFHQSKHHLLFKNTKCLDPVFVTETSPVLQFNYMLACFLSTFPPTSVKPESLGSTTTQETQNNETGGRCSYKWGHISIIRADLRSPTEGRIIFTFQLL